jgi:hypothetical protein
MRKFSGSGARGGNFNRGMNRFNNNNGGQRRNTRGRNNQNFENVNIKLLNNQKNLKLFSEK